MVLKETERTAIENLRTQEKSCVEKYQKYAQQAIDPELKNLFEQLHKKEHTGQADDGQAVGAVGGDLKLHHVVVQAGHRLDVVAGLAVLVEDKDAVGDAVGELPLLGVEVGQGADSVALGVIGHQVAHMQVHALGVGAGGMAMEICSMWN